ncbi:MAG: hypothetical protein K2X39_01150, partial [Silvanigrellaceae bacterium]|nr:hypothetical protein [Silvanigrellaceae bacterium]
MTIANAHSASLKERPLFPAREIFFIFFICNVLFFVLQLTYIYYGGQSFIHAVVYPWGVYREILAVLIIQLLLYVLLSIVQTSWLWGIRFLYKKPHDYERYLLLVFFSTITCLLSLNAYFYPLSKFSMLFFPALPMIFLTIFGVGSLSILLVLSFLTFYQLLQKCPVVLMSILTVIIGLTIYTNKEPTWTQLSIPERPNLIMIGIDSLIYDQLNEKETPHLYRFFKNSVQFEEVISP